MPKPYMPNVLSARVVYYPRADKTDPENVRFVRLGVRVDLEGGVWWFHSLRDKKHTERLFSGKTIVTRVPSQSWTKHTPGPLEYHRDGSIVTQTDGTPVRHKDTVESYETQAELINAYEHCPQLIQALYRSLKEALIDDELKRNRRAS